MQVKTKNRLRNIYLFLYDTFASDTNDVMREFDISRVVALRNLNILEASGLVCGDLQESRGYSGGGMYESRSRKLVGCNIVWQCWTTYDSENREDATKRIDSFLDKS